MSLSKSRKRSYRYRVKCEECEKEFDSDYVEAHSRIVHSGRKVKFLPVVESSELKLSGFFSESSAAVDSPGQTQEAPLFGCSPESEQRTISSTYESVANIQPDPESIDHNSLRRIKTFLRSTTGQDRLSSIAVINIERKYVNKTMQNDMQRIIHIFGCRNNRSLTSFRAQMGTFYLSLHGFVF